MIQFLSQIDLSLFFLINRQAHMAVLNWLMPVIQNETIFLPPFILLALYFFWRGPSRVRWALLAAVIAVAVTDPLCTYILKPLFERPRPYSVLPFVNVYDRGWLPPGPPWIDRSWSLPSNHAANVTAGAVVIAGEYPRLWPVSIVIILLVAFSRVYTGVHFPMDVMAGILVGLGTAGLVLGIKRKIKARPSVSAH